MKVEGYPIKWRYIRVFHRAPNPGFSEEPLCAFGKVLMVGQGDPRDLDCNLYAWCQYSLPDICGSSVSEVVPFGFHNSARQVLGEVLIHSVKGRMKVRGL